MRPQLIPAEMLPLFDDGFVRSCQLFEEYVYRLTLDVFRRCGLARVCETPVTTEEAIAAGGLEPHVAKIPVDWIFRELATRGVMERLPGDAPRFRLKAPLPEPDAARVRAEQAEHDPSSLPAYAIADIAAAHYPDVLRGEMTGERVLFGPERIGAWHDYFSNGNALYAISNAVGAIVSESVFPEAGGAILELGGGLGSAAAALLRRLSARERLSRVSQYRFTDVSLPFVRNAQKNLSALFPDTRIAFGLLDMNKPFPGEIAPAGTFALIHAVNTLHVAADLAFTLGQARDALAPGGCLVISECVRPHPGHPVYVEFVFNLLDAFRDPVLEPSYRPNGGFLTPEQWTAAFESCGFRNVRIVPDIAKLRREYPSFVVAAVAAERA